MRVKMMISVFATTRRGFQGNSNIFCLCLKALVGSFFNIRFAADPIFH